MKKIAVAVAALSLIGSVAAQQLKPEEMIKFRQAGYKTMAWNMQKIKAQTDGPADKFDKALVGNAAKAIQGVANSGLGMLYGAGTDKDVGDLKTNVKPEFFDSKNKEELGKLAKNFNLAANKLAEVAAAGDQKAIAAQFGDTGKTCKACHDKFRKEDKK